MRIPIIILIASIGAQDYASEVLYPDDLIPVEDIEGKNDLISNFLILNLDQHDAAISTTTTTTTTEEYDNDDDDDVGQGDKQKK